VDERLLGCPAAVWGGCTGGRGEAPKAISRGQWRWWQQRKALHQAMAQAPPGWLTAEVALLTHCDMVTGPASPCVRAAFFASAVARDGFCCLERVCKGASELTCLG